MVVQHTNPPPVQVLAALLLIQLPNDSLEEQLRMARVLQPLHLLGDIEESPCSQLQTGPAPGRVAV